MNVLMFGWEFPPNISGGLGTACHGIVKGLSTFDDIHVVFVIPKAHGNEQINKYQLISADQVDIECKSPSPVQHPVFIKVLEVPSALSPYLNPESYSRKLIQTEKKGEISQHGKRIYFSGKYGPNLYDEINNYAIVAKTIAEENEFQLIHAHDWLTFPAAIAAKKASGAPLILHIHSTDFDRSGGSVNPTIFRIEKQGMEEADRIITVSNLIKKRLISQYNISPEKITTVYNAIDPVPEKKKTVKHSGKIKTVTFLGRITIQKGPAYFAEVARLIHKKMKNVRFIMAGNGELRDQIVECCAKYRISNRFHFTGFLCGDEVSEILNKSDVFIMPSVSEPFGIVPLEAMQANVPVIISLQSGIAEVIRSAVKADFWDIHAMADAVHGILKYKKLSKTMINDGKKELGKLNWVSTASQIRQIYLNTIPKLVS
ncbi:MAG: glycosyltransferase [Prolixibacteraceae bacterium]